VAVTTAVVPVAGLGTRLRPLTHSVPKGLLPLGGQPVVQHVVDELTAAGTTRVVLVTDPERGRAFAAHFAAVAGGPQVACVEQPEPRGLGDALLRAGSLTRDEPFVVALGDAVLVGDAVARLTAAFERARAVAAIAVEEVPVEAASRYGIVVPAGEGEVFGVAAMVEKPARPPSRLAVAARYVLGPAVLDALRHTPPAAHGELELTDALRRVIAGGATVVGVRLRAGERRLDVGTLAGYAAAFVELALADPRMASAVRARVGAGRPS
jgi:UTP--glucose-1-phosphate uridylyltransferase